MLQPKKSNLKNPSDPKPKRNVGFKDEVAVTTYLKDSEGSMNKVTPPRERIHRDPNRNYNERNYQRELQKSGTPYKVNPVVEGVPQQRPHAERVDGAIGFHVESIEHNRQMKELQNPPKHRAPIVDAQQQPYHPQQQPQQQPRMGWGSPMQQDMRSALQQPQRPQVRMGTGRPGSSNLTGMQRMSGSAEQLNSRAASNLQQSRGQGGSMTDLRRAGDMNDFRNSPLNRPRPNLGSGAVPKMNRGPKM